jgi:hypothetical protein
VFYLEYILFLWQRRLVPTAEGPNVAIALSVFIYLFYEVDFIPTAKMQTVSRPDGPTRFSRFVLDG